MQIEVISGITKLTASEGMRLYSDGAIGTEVWLAPDDSPDNWEEVDEDFQIPGELSEEDDMRNALKILGVEL